MSPLFQLRPTALSLAALWLLACSSETPAPATALGGTGGSAGSAGISSGAGTATAGNNAAGSTGATGGGTGGAAGGAGGGAAAGVAGGGSGGAGGNGEAAALDAVKATFDMYRVECHCTQHTGNGNCDLEPDVDVQRKQVTVGGDAATTYEVKLHVRGVVEPNQYLGGTPGADTDHFYVGGGKSSTPNYTWYSLIVTEPAEMYFFNFGQVNGHTHILVDDHVTLRVKGGTSAYFGVNDQVAFDKNKPNGEGAIPDGHHVSNDPNDVVPGVPPAPEPYDGQFLQFDVESVTVVK